MIEAMKQALEALEDATRHIWLGDKNGVEANIRSHKQCESLRQAIAEAEQEPVGEAYLCEKCQTPFDGAWECPSCGHNTSTKEPIYTHPLKREWVGLEASEYVAFYNQFANYQEENPDDSGWWAFANAIEQALKEKNI